MSEKNPFYFCLSCFLQVDESILSSDQGGVGDDLLSGDNNLAAPHLPVESSFPRTTIVASSSSSTSSPVSPSYPWVQMALPGGGIVSVPLVAEDTAASSASNLLLSSEPLLQKNAPPESLASAPPPTYHSHHYHPHQLQQEHNNQQQQQQDNQQKQQPQHQHHHHHQDLLTVTAGEPVTHFNLDQLLEIVQSFQLDTTLAGTDETGVQRHLEIAQLASGGKHQQLQGSALIPKGSEPKVKMEWKQRLHLSIELVNPKK